MGLQTRSKGSSSVHFATTIVFSCDDECGGGLILYIMISDSPMYGELSRKLDSETTRHSSSSGSSDRRDEVRNTYKQPH